MNPPLLPGTSSLGGSVLRTFPVWVQTVFVDDVLNLPTRDTFAVGLSIQNGELQFGISKVPCPKRDDSVDLLRRQS